MSIHTQRLTQRFMAAEDDGSTGGGAPAADDPPTITADMQALIDAEVNKVTNGLKNKNTELIGTIRTVKDDLKRFDGIDPDAVRTILQRFSDDEEGKLLAAGKVDEVLTKRTDRLRADYEKKLQAESEGRTTAEAKAAKLADKSLAGALRDSAIKAGARPTALEDIVLRSRGTWVLGDNGEPVAMIDEQAVLGKDGKTPLPMNEWLDSLRETAPHLWPDAQGTNAPGSRTGAGVSNKTVSQMTPDEKSGFIKANGLDAWQNKISAEYARPPKT